MTNQIRLNDVGQSPYLLIEQTVQPEQRYFDSWGWHAWQYFNHLNHHGGAPPTSLQLRLRLLLKNETQ